MKDRLQQGRERLEETREATKALCEPVEPAMRHLLDTYIRAEESEQLSGFDDLTLVELIVERGEKAVEELPEGIRKSREAVAETIENNVRRRDGSQSQVLREDVGTARSPDPATQARGD